MYAKEVFAIRPVNESRYVILRYADIVWVEASNNNSVFHMVDGSSFTVGRKLEVVEKFCPLETGKMNNCKRSLKDFVWKGDCFS